MLLLSCMSRMLLQMTQILKDLHQLPVKFWINSIVTSLAHLLPFQWKCSPLVIWTFPHWHLSSCCALSLQVFMIIPTKSVSVPASSRVHVCISPGLCSPRSTVPRSIFPQVCVILTLTLVVVGVVMMSNVYLGEHRDDPLQILPPSLVTFPSPSSASFQHQLGTWSHRSPPPPKLPCIPLLIFHQILPVLYFTCFL